MREHELTVKSSIQSTIPTRMTRVSHGNALAAIHDERNMVPLVGSMRRSATLK
jgi:hypothetical protein